MGTEQCYLWLCGMVVTDILLGCSGSGIRRRELLNKKWPNMNDKKILMYINKAQVMDVGSYLEKVRYKRLMKQDNFK